MQGLDQHESLSNIRFADGFGVCPSGRARPPAALKKLAAELKA